MQFIKDLYQEAISVFARSWFEKIIPILESNGNVRLRQVGSQGLVKQAIKMDELKYTLDRSMINWIIKIVV